MTIFLCIESTIWRPESVLVKRAAKTSMLHHCDVENYEDMLATIVKKGRIIGNCEEELPKKPVGQLSADSRPTVGLLSADSRPTVGRLLAHRWPTDGRQVLPEI